MNMLLKVRGYWNITRGKLKQRLAWMTDNQQQFMEGKRDELKGRIQKHRRQGGKFAVK